MEALCRYSKHSTMFLLALVFTSYLSCNQKDKENKQLVDGLPTISKKTLDDPTSENKSGKVEYAVIIHGDTSALKCIIGTENGRKAMRIRFHEALTYNVQKQQLSEIFAELFKDPSMSSLESIFIGRLVSAGDLAITVSNQLHKEVGEEMIPEDYKIVSTLLMKTNLVADFDSLLAPYSLKIDKIYLEKVFKMNSSLLVKEHNIDTAPLTIPNKVLDGMVWLTINSDR